MQAMYSFYVNLYYGELQGLFLADTETVKDCIGKTMVFGEVLGKHSEVEFDLEEDMLTLITSDPKEIEQVVNILGKSFPIGYDPVQCIQERGW